MVCCGSQNLLELVGVLDYVYASNAAAFRFSDSEKGRETLAGRATLPTCKE